MKKFRRIFTYVSAGLLVLALIAAFLFQGLFFALAPPAYHLVTAFAKQAGYEFRCFDLHGDWRCVFIPQAVADPVTAKKQLDEKLTDLVGCRSDADCVVTRKGGCATKGWFRGGSTNDGKCVCLTGPVVFGCMSQAQAKLYEGQKRYQEQ